jgi:hypothetical protein
MMDVGVISVGDRWQELAAARGAKVSPARFADRRNDPALPWSSAR